MLEKGTSWNSKNVHVIYEYEGEDYISNPYSEVRFIINNLHEDPVGTLMKFEFKYQNDIDYFWEMIRDEKDRFKTIPTEMFTEDGQRIQCKFNIDTPDRPIAICQVSEDTILAWRVSIEEAIYKMLPKTILVNEGFGDMFGLRATEVYRKRVLQLRLIGILKDKLEAEGIHIEEKEVRRRVEIPVVEQKFTANEDIADDDTVTQSAPSSEAPQYEYDEVTGIRKDIDIDEMIELLEKFHRENNTHMEVNHLGE